MSNIFFANVLEWNEGNREQFVVNFEKPEQNRGFYCFAPKQIAVNHERVDAFFIMKPLTDPRFLITPKGFEAYLVENGMVIKEPALAPLLTNGIDDMEKAEKVYGAACNQTFDTMRMRVAEYKKDKSRHYRYTHLIFPNDQNGTTEFFNKTKDTTKVDAHTRFVKQRYEDPKNNGFDFVATYVSWKVAVDGTQCSIKADDDDDDKLFEEAAKGLQGMSI
jgi:hypothetical protein